MKRKLLLITIFLSIFFLCSCTKNDDNNESNIVKNTPGYEKWNTKIDYSDNNNWLNVPTEITKDIDVIYYYPTSYTPEAGSGVVVSDIDDQNMKISARDWFDRQATIFDDTCNIYAPFYRQLDASYALTLTNEENDELFQYAASKDAADALDYYFKNYNNGRPFFLAGHSQGSETVLYLLKNYFKEHQDYYSRMIAAYAIGYSVTEEYLNENTHLKFATSDTDTGVIISYNTEGIENSGKHNAVLLKNTKCINPINWKTDSTYASKEENLDSRINGNDVSGIADAYINVERGSLVTTADLKYSMGTNKIVSSIFGPQCFHGNDYDLYYYSLKKNVSDRVNAYLNK